MKSLLGRKKQKLKFEENATNDGNLADIAKLRDRIKELEHRAKTKARALEDSIADFCATFKVFYTPRFNSKRVIQKPKALDDNASLSKKAKSSFTWLSHERLLKKIITAVEKARGVCIVTNECFSSKTCSCCLHYTNPGASETFECHHCGAVMHRDANAAVNILRYGSSNHRMGCTERIPGSVEDARKESSRRSSVFTGPIWATRIHGAFGGACCPAPRRPVLRQMR
ncbi:hypothetical protein HDU97_004328 [Phlyctochytrium planicorne]|nr:hypothetical protein HDU97_004328 [Phlyctochytrium planicorne]